VPGVKICDNTVMAIRTQANEYSNSLTQGPFLIVGLGNVGAKYDQTRHNAGFMALERFAHQFELGEFKEKSELSAELLETNMAGEKLILAKPNTFMNKSGLAVVKLQNYFSVNDPRILVVYDDVDIDFGTIRSRVGGGNGGHNGIKSIEQVIGDQFARIRIGVKNDHLKNQETSDFVLSNFSRAESSELDQIMKYVANQIEAFVEQRFDETSATPSSSA
jgi:PTH1 family peptidyl-tRNA hydrolase